MESGNTIRQQILYRFFLRVQIFTLILMVANLAFSLKIHTKFQIAFDILFLVITGITTCLIVCRKKTNLAVTFFVYTFAIAHPINCYLMEAIDSIPFIWSPIIFFVLLFVAREKHQKLAPWIYLAGVFTAMIFVQLTSSNSIPVDKIDSIDLLFNIILQVSILSYINHCNNWYHQEILAKEKEENLESAKLISILCHDIANPLGNIQNLTSEDFTKSFDKDELLKLISFSADTGLNVVNKVKAQRSLKDGKYEIKKENVNLKKLLLDSIKILDFKIKNKNINIELQVADEITVSTDPVILTNNIVNNILTNAIKFSEKNSSILIQASTKDNGVDVTISDKGIGIPKTLINDLFDINKATSRKGTEGEAGTGYGMVLIKDSIEKLGGQLKITSKTKEDSEQEHGTQVSLLLC